MEKKIFGLDTSKEQGLENKLLFAITSYEDSLKCAKIIENSKLKRISHYNLPEGFKTDIADKVYVYCIDGLTSDHMKEIIGKFIKKYENQNLSDVFEIIEIFTKKISSELTIDKLEGDIGEALFIQKCIQLKYDNEIFNCCNEKFEPEARIDFEILNKKFEIKTSTMQKQEINITDKQILENPNVVVVLAEFNKNDKTILMIYDEIKSAFNGKLPIWLEHKYVEYSREEIKDFIFNRTINSQIRPNFFFFDKNKLPTLHEGIDSSNIIKKITYTLNLLTNTNTQEEFDNELKAIINSK